MHHNNKNVESNDGKKEEIKEFGEVPLDIITPKLNKYHNSQIQICKEIDEIIEIEGLNGDHDIEISSSTPGPSSLLSFTFPRFAYIL